MTFDFDAVVVGAGVVGLAVARQLSRQGQQVLLVEQAGAIGTGTSSRNSEVVHGGLYYPRGSLKARHCVAGRQKLYAFCKDAGVSARQLGKLVVAGRPEELSALEALHRTAVENGVEGLALLDGAQANALEPALACAGAMHSPETGIVDAHGFMLALLADAEAHGATLVLHTRFEHAEKTAGGLSLSLRDRQGEVAMLSCKRLVNSAGHGAHDVAAAIAGFDAGLLPPRYLAKGSYCTVSGASPFARLIYPLPVPGALGIHVTIDMNGRARLGPDILWVDEEDYSLPQGLEAKFAEACASYWPGIRQRALTADYCGIRPKISGPGQPAADFMLQDETSHGLQGLVNLFGIESPGLTASLSLAEDVASRLA